MMIDSSFDPAIEIRNILDNPAYDLPELLADPIRWILDGGNDTQALLDQIQDKLNQLSVLGSTELTHLLATWCCVEALHQSPHWKTWKIIQRLQYNSWVIENWLSPLILAAIEDRPSKKNNFIVVAKRIISETNELFLQEPTEENQKSQPIQEKLYWNSQSHPLQEIWWGIDRHSHSSYWGIRDWFQILLTLDETQALSTISALQNPFLVQQFIICSIDNTGSPPNSWQYFVRNAPVAFEENGRWNCHFLAPLLLAEFRSHLLQQKTHYGSTPEEQKQIKEQIENWVANNIQVIQQRKDAMPLLKRWSAWLMYRLLIEGGDKVDDVTSSAFIDATLLTAIGHLFTTEIPISTEIAPDAMHWERWCNLACYSYWAQNGTTIVCDYQIFLSEWNLSVDDWYEDKGQQLRDHANHLISTYSQTRFPSDIAYLLAYPIAQSNKGIDDWCKTWVAAFYLRELTEFGTKNNSYENRSKASELLFFLWQVGFALFDLKAQKSNSSDSDSARHLASLFQHIHTTVQEMIIIADTLNREKWQLMPELLAVRRLLWEEQENTNNQEYVVFNEDDNPRFSDYLKLLKHQESELIQLLNTALRNNVMTSTIKGHIELAGISIEKIIYKAKKLNRLSEKHYPLNAAFITSLQQFIEEKDPT